jgi:DNA ligase-associated metallophosphoesterase
MWPEPGARIESQPIDFHGHILRLYPQRALHWPEQSMLLLADLHLGKGDAFRRAGIALPRGGTNADLQRLSMLIEHSGVHRVVVLGDLVHGPLPADAHWRAQWQAFLERHAEVEFAAVLGNHDRALRGARDFGRLRLLGAEEAIDGLHLQHEPAQASDAPTLCGHLHPVLRLRQPGLPARLPCFWQRHAQLVLPAFSDFTGGWPVPREPGDRLWACAGGELIRLGDVA